MTVFEFLYTLPRRVSALFVGSKKRIVPPQAPPVDHRDDIADDVWKAFWVIGQGGPIAKSDPSPFRNQQ